MGLYIALVVISIIFLITLLWLHLTLRSRFNVVTYTILLLLDDELKQQQKAELQKWVRREEFTSEVDLQRRTRFIITQLAQTFAQKKSFEQASNLLRNLKNK